MLASAVTFTVMTILIKYLGEDYPPALQTFYRQSAGLLVLLPAILRNPRGVMHTSRPGLMLFRSATGTIAMLLSFYAYQKLPLADANALSFTRTLWLVPLAAFGALLLNINFVLSGIGQISFDLPYMVAEVLLIAAYPVVGLIGLERLAKRILMAVVAKVRPARA